MEVGGCRRPVPLAGTLRHALHWLMVRKTSVYLDDAQSERLVRLAHEEGRSQADIVRDAIASYEPAPARDREFELADGFPRIDRDPRPISEIPERELLEGFGR